MRATVLLCAAIAAMGPGASVGRGEIPSPSVPTGVRDVYPPHHPSCRLRAPFPGFELPGDNGAAFPAARGVAFGDVNGDGCADVVSLRTNGGLRVSLRDDTGYFDLPLALTGTTSTSDGFPVLNLTDFNGDGVLDIGTTEISNDRVMLRFGQGDGTFGAATFLASLSRPRCMTHADLDGDGIVDIVVGNEITGTLAIIISHGDGTFEPTRYLNAAIDQISIDVRDIDGDGDNDIVSANQDSSTLSVFENLGWAIFDTRVDYAVGGVLNTVALVDLDVDGDLDIAVSVPALDQLKMFTNDGTGLFVASGSLGVGDSPGAIVVDDIDDDGDTDLAVANEGSNGRTVTIVRNLGAGALTAEAPLPAQSGIRGLALADADNDGDLDLAGAANHGPVIMINSGGGTFATRIRQTSLSPNSYLYGEVAVGDIDGDGDQDTVNLGFKQSNGTYLFVLRNAGDGSFAPLSNLTERYPILDFARRVLLLDANGDGTLDAVVSRHSSGGNPALYVFLNDGTGHFLAPLNPTPGLDFDALAAGDLDDDGDQDLVSTHSFAGNLAVLLNPGQGAFVQSASIAIGIEPAEVALGDLDGDGDLDAIAISPGTNPTTGTVAVLFNDGHAVLSTPTVYPATSPRALALGDFDGDGDLDFAIGGTSSNSMLRLFDNDGTGQFSLSHTYLTGSIHRLITADVNRDGDVDLFADGTRVFRNDGSGDMQAHWNNAAEGEQMFAVGDINGDSFVDVVSTPGFMGATGFASGGSTVALIMNELGLQHTFCPADIDGDGEINAGDFNILAANFGNTVPPNTLGDLNGDGLVNVADFAIFAADYGRSCP